MKRTHSLALAMMLAACLATRLSADVTLVADGQARAVIVTPDKPTPVARYAAEELRHHVAKATGVTLEILAETQAAGRVGSRVFIGPCNATERAGIRADGLAPEQSMLKTVGGDLFLVGGDGGGDPLSMRTPAGTLFAVYELLDRVLGVRWLWPGELGEVVPRVERVVVPATDRTVSPLFFQRQLRNGLGLRPKHSPRGFTKKGYAKFKRDLLVWLRRQRMGRSVELRWGHSFNSYWKRYGAAHPEYFELVDGRRGPRSSGARFAMCVSNTELHRLIVGNWRWRRRANPEAAPNINLCENDVYGRCECRNCRAWDGPDIKPITKRYAARCVSDRYARFWQRVQALASRIDPNVICTAYAYVNYAPPPQTDIRLNDNIVVGLVPDIFFPRSPEEHQWVRRQWAGWERTGAQLFLRPNYFLDGYCMPYIFVHQFADEFRFDIRHHMAATDFDSLTSMFGTQGVNAYYLARQLVRPEADVDEILGEYYAGFGPAAGAVKAYFDYWERYLMGNRERFRQIAKELSGNWARFPRMSYALYPAEAFAKGYALLDKAKAAAGDNAILQARVMFLRKGLAHAEKCTQVAAALMDQTVPIAPSKRIRLVNELREFRKQIESDDVANLNFCAWLEERAFGPKRQLGPTGEPVRALVAQPDAAVEVQPFSVRGPHGFIALLKAGERLRARIECKRLGRYTTPCTWSVFGPDERLIANGQVQPNDAVDVDAPAHMPGLYNLVVDSQRNAANVTLLNDHAALVGREVHVLGIGAPMFVYVPKRVKQFTVTLESPAPGETMALAVLDPDGNEVAKGATGKEKVYRAQVKVEPKQAGRAFQLVTSPAPTGVTEDATLKLDTALPAYWSAAADRLLVPADK